MTEVRRHKAPEHRAAHHHRNAVQPKTARPVAWLPGTDADFIAWGQAVEIAKRESDNAWNEARLRQYEGQWRQAAEAAHDLLQLTLYRAFPSGFWEGMDALFAGQAEDLEPYLVFLEADPVFFRSGYAKADAIRGLKRLLLAPEQIERLQAVVLHVVDAGFRREFRDYCRLARKVQSPDWITALEARLSSRNGGLALRAQWVLDACRKK